MPGEKILVTDDEPRVLQLCTRILTENGYNVRGAVSGQEALAYLETEPFDLLIVDIWMPDIDGLTVLRRGRQIDPSLVAVVITGHTTLENAIATLRAGACHLLLKPFDGAELLSAVQDALERKRNEQERQRLRAQLPILEIAQALTSEGDAGLLAQRLLEPVLHEVPADRAAMLLLDQEDCFTVVRTSGLPSDQDLSSWRTRLSGQASRKLIGGSEALLVRPVDLPVPLQSLLQLPEASTIVWLPLRTLRRCVGALALARLPGQPIFTPSEMNLLSIVGGQMATAIENAYLYDLIGRGKREWEETFDAIADGVSIHEGDWRIVRANKALAEQVGTTVRNLIGRHCYELFHRSSTPPDDCPMREAFERGRPTEAEMENSVLGGIFLCQVYPLSERPGRPRQAVHILRNITARRRIEAELRQRNEELTALNSIATALGQSLDLEQVLNTALEKVLEVLEVDGAWIDLLGEDTLPGQIVQRAVPLKVAQSFETIRRAEGLGAEVLRTGSPVVVQSVSDIPPGLAGSELSVLALIPIRAGDQVMGMLGCLRRTPRHLSPAQIQILSAVGHQLGVAVRNARLSQQAAEIRVLRELDALRSELIANVSHEVRTPLGLIEILSTTLLRQDLTLDDATRRSLLADIVDETDKLERIVDNLLDLSRMEGRRFTLQKRRVDIGRLAGEVIETMRARSNLHRLEADFPQEALVAEADPQRLEQVLYNLLDNAIKYSPAGGTITVQGRREGPAIVIRVSDQGIGIPRAELERIFERFYRVENEATIRQRGAGLGLAVCRGIVEAHGGRIWAESVPGTGSTFTFTLPIGEPSTASSSEAPPKRRKR